jgi:hypothetical protein
VTDQLTGLVDTAARQLADACRDLGTRAQMLVLTCDEYARGAVTASGGIVTASDVDAVAHDVEDVIERWESCYEAHLDAQAEKDDRGEGQ